MTTDNASLLPLWHEALIESSVFSPLKSWTRVKYRHPRWQANQSSLLPIVSTNIPSQKDEQHSCPLFFPCSGNEAWIIPPDGGVVVQDTVARKRITKSRNLIIQIPEDSILSFLRSFQHKKLERKNGKMVIPEILLPAAVGASSSFSGFHRFSPLSSSSSSPTSHFQSETLQYFSDEKSNTEGCSTKGRREQSLLSKGIKRGRESLLLSVSLSRVSKSYV